MVELIPRQAAIAYAISGYTREIDGENWIRVSEVRESIKAVPSAQPEWKEGIWIPITERLPGREWVLCRCQTNIYEVLSLRDGYWYHDPKHEYMKGFVTHWMPLPEPPAFNEVEVEE